MHKIKKFRILIIAVMAVFTLQGGIFAYSKINTYINESSEQQNPSSPQSTQQAAISDEKPVNTDSIEISQDIQDIIKNSDPASFEKNITKYKQVLVALNVHSKFKNEIERLLKEGHKLPDILTAYAFLNDAYGKMEGIQSLVAKKESGKTWESIFEEYNKQNPEFIPSAFESDYLESLMKISKVTPDDIMIADRISQKTSIPFKEVIETRISSSSWKDINASYNIVNGLDKFPHVPVTPEQIKKYTSGSMTEDMVVQAFVIAQKMQKNPEDIVNKVKAGYTKEKIYAECYQQKYY